MNKRRCLFLPLLCGIGILLCTGCKGEDKMDTIADVPFIVQVEEGRPLLKSVGFTLYSEKMAELPETVESACGVGTFAIDFNDHIHSKYYKAEAQSWAWTPFLNFTMNEELDPLVTDTISLAKGYNVINSVLFLVATQELVDGREYDYRLNYDPSHSIVNNNYRFDLNVFRVKDNTESNKSSKKEKLFMAFDLDGFFKKYDVPEKADTFNLSIKYCKGWTEEGLYAYDSIRMMRSVILP